MSGLRQKTRGAASLITVIFVSIVLSIMVLGFVRLALNEQRQSTDDDLTTRAFYAAESGLEDAKRAIRDYLNGNTSGTINDLSDLRADDCRLPNGYGDGQLSPSDEFDTAYTCMLIDLSPPDYAVKLDKNQTKQIGLLVPANDDGDNTNDNYTLVIEWHRNEDPTAGDGENPPARASGTQTLPPESSWQSGGELYPAMLRTSLFYYPANGITRANLNSSLMVAFLNPTNVAAIPTINYDSSSPPNPGIDDASCNNSRDYVCRQDIAIDNLDDDVDHNFVLRLTSLYRGAYIRVSLEDILGEAVPFDGEQAIVDVTGRAADVFRRIETRVSLDSSFADLLPDAGIISADDICKNMVVPPTGVAGFQPNDCSRP